jgi:hypothetical protein
MNSDYYEKKTYKSFIIIFIIMIFSSLLPIFTNNYFKLSSSVSIKLMFLIMNFCLIIISYIIYKKERVYWITSYDYETACNMTSEERKSIGKKLFRSFRICFGISTIYIFISLIIGTSVLVDSIVFIVSVVAACIKA